MDERHLVVDVRSGMATVADFVDVEMVAIDDDSVGDGREW